MTLRRSGWTQVALGDICEFRYGKSLTSGARRGMDFPVYGSNGVVGGNHAPLTKGEAIIIGRKGSFGEVHYSPTACWPIDTTYFVDESATACNLRWLSYRLAGLGLKGLNKSAAVPGLNREDAYRQRLLLPPMPDQRRIAEVLDRADALRAKRRAALALLDDLTQSIFLDMFGDPQENLAGFDLRPLSEWLLPDRPMTYGILMPGPDTPGGVPYVRVVDMREGGVAVAGVKRTTPEMSQQYKRSLLSSGDLLMSIRGHVGRLALIPDELEGANITQDSARLSISAKSRHYALEALRTPAMQRWMAKRIKGVAVRGINLGDLKKLPLPVPPLELQTEFAQRCEAQTRARRAQASSVSLVDGLFASLQQRAFAGEL